MGKIIWIAQLGPSTTWHGPRMIAISCLGQQQEQQSKTYHRPMKGKTRVSGRVPRFPLKHREPHQLPIIRTGNAVVTRVCRFRVRSTPHEYLVVMNLGIMPVLERERKVGVEL